ncbi:uncharacterized protein LOC121825198 [Peromyscus maniculatus bairdii]|uniref:uncharacterized protein LOC121825198 n=1 Tax=Peromyscus maniculatus bairdii TaxID=230844 RepID=UPI003FD41103
MTPRELSKLVIQAGGQGRVRASIQGIDPKASPIQDKGSTTEQCHQRHEFKTDSSGETQSGGLGGKTSKANSPSPARSLHRAISSPGLRAWSRLWTRSYSNA